MKHQFLESLRCPFDGGAALELELLEQDRREIRTGRLTCATCRREFPIHKGIVDFLDPADEALAREVAGWIQLAGPLHENLVTVMTSLPHFPHPPWPHVAPDFFQIFEEIDFAGKRVVDIGAGRTWSTRYLMTLGRAQQAAAIDVLTTRFLGLETADIFFEQDGIHFERVRGDLHHLPLADGWADAVFSCASIHHSSNLDRLFAEARRVLAPGGHLIFVSEPSKKESILGNQPVNAETALGINENYYSLAEYQAALGRHGFSYRRLLPRTIRYRLLYPDPDFESGMPPFARRLARRPFGRALLLRWLRNARAGAWLYRYWSLPLSIVARKPL